MHVLHSVLSKCSRCDSNHSKVPTIETSLNEINLRQLRIGQINSDWRQRRANLFEWQRWNGGPKKCWTTIDWMYRMPFWCWIEKSIWNRSPFSNFGIMVSIGGWHNPQMIDKTRIFSLSSCCSGARWWRWQSMAEIREQQLPEWADFKARLSGRRSGFVYGKHTESSHQTWMQDMCDQRSRRNGFHQISDAFAASLSGKKCMRLFFDDPATKDSSYLDNFPPFSGR